MFTTDSAGRFGAPIIWFQTKRVPKVWDYREFGWADFGQHPSRPLIPSPN
jgi:hypothetical protein